jgi:hypothetical protein
MAIMYTKEKGSKFEGLDKKAAKKIGIELSKRKNVYKYALFVSVIINTLLVCRLILI